MTSNPSNGQTDTLAVDPNRGDGISSADTPTIIVSLPLRILSACLLIYIMWIMDVNFMF